MKKSSDKYRLPSSIGYKEMRQKYGVTLSELAEFLQVGESEIQELEESEYATDDLRKKIESFFEGEDSSPELLRFWRNKSLRLRMLILYMLRNMEEVKAVAHFNLYDIEDGMRSYKLDLEDAQKSLEIDQTIHGC